MANINNNGQPVPLPPPQAPGRFHYRPSRRQLAVQIGLLFFQFLAFYTILQSQSENTDSLFSFSMFRHENASLDIETLLTYGCVSLTVTYLVLKELVQLNQPEPPLEERQQPGAPGRRALEGFARFLM